MVKVEHYTELVLDNLILLAPSFVAAILTLCLGIELIKKQDVLLANSLKRLYFFDAMRPFIVALAAFLLKIILVLIAVPILGIQLLGLIIVVVMGYAIGISVQGSCGNFVSITLVLFLKASKVNGRIQVYDTFKKVEGIGTFDTI